MVEGRCLLSSYVTGDSPNNRGVCSPAHAVSWEEHDQVLSARLSGNLIDQYAPGEAAAYPLCAKVASRVAGGSTTLWKNRLSQCTEFAPATRKDGRRSAED